jgi:hypothetical protein
VYNGKLFWRLIERLVLAMNKYLSKHVCVNSDTTMTSYVTIKLPKSLVEQIDEVLEQQNLGYASRAELVKDAVRKLLAANKKHSS